LGGLEGGRVFKISGVRRLLDSMRKDSFVTRSGATERILRATSFKESELVKILGDDFERLVAQYFPFKADQGEDEWSVERSSYIQDERLRSCYQGDFRRFRKLMIGQNWGEDLSPGNAFGFLLRRYLFRAGLNLHCRYCLLPSWLALREVDDYWTC